MLVKLRDSTPSKIDVLERIMASENGSQERLDVRSAIARMKADTTTGKACDFLNNWFADSSDWMLIHDLRLEIGRSLAVANHVLIDRGLRFYWLDTHYMDCGLTIHPSGACTAHYAGDNKICSTPIASPLRKLQKDLRTFSQAVRQAQSQLGWSGLVKQPIIQGYVLTSSSIKNSVPRDGSVDTSPLISKDSLFSLIWESREGENCLWSRRTSQDTLREVASALIEQHSPVVKPALFEQGVVAGNNQKTDDDSAHCYYCRKGVSEDEREHSFRNMDVYDGRVVCFKCQDFAEDSRREMRVACG